MQAGPCQEGETPALLRTAHMSSRMIDVTLSEHPFHRSAVRRNW